MTTPQTQRLRPIEPLIALSGFLITSLACVGGGLGALDGFDAVDEDFSRPSPTVTTQSALASSCDDSDAEEGDPLYQRDVVFEHALCLCGSLEEVGNGLTTSSRSHLLGGDPDQGHVGINGSAEVVGNFTVGGTLDVAQGLEGVGSLNVGGDLISGRDVDVVGDWGVGGDAWIDGDLSGVGTMNINGDLYLTGGLDTVGPTRYTQGRRGFRYRGAPCGCGANQIIDVAAEVAARRADNNNAALPDTIGAVNMTLTSGEYFVSNPGALVGSAKLTIQGRVAIFVEGDFDSVGNLNIQLAENAELELWVSGTINNVGNLSIDVASADRPRAFKLYMGGAGAALVNVGNATLVGAVYAPEVDIEYVGNLTVHGSVFARNLKGTGNLNIVHDTDLPAPDACADAHYQTALP